MRLALEITRRLAFATRKDWQQCVPVGAAVEKHAKNAKISLSANLWVASRKLVMPPLSSLCFSNLGAGPTDLFNRCLPSPPPLSKGSIPP